VMFGEDYLPWNVSLCEPVFSSVVFFQSPMFVFYEKSVL